MEGCILHLEIDLDDLLGVIPATAGIGHEDSLEEPEERDPDQIADEEVGIEEGQTQGHEEDDDEDVDHPLLGIDRTDPDDFLAVLDGGLRLVEVDIVLDVDDGPVGTRNNGLDRGAGEPVDHATAHEETEDDLRLDEAEFRNDVPEHLLQENDDPEDHGGGADDGRSDEDRLGGRLEGVPCAVARLEEVLGLLEVGSDTEVLLHHVLGVGTGLDHGQFIDGLGVIGNRTEAVDGNRHGTHAEEAEGHEAEREDRGRKLEGIRKDGHHRGCLGHEIGDEHEEQNRQAFPEGGEIAGNQTGENVQRSAALAGGVDALLAVAGTCAGEDLGEFRNQRAGNGPAADDDGQGQPESHGVTHRGEFRQQEIAGAEGHSDRNDRGDPDQIGQGVFEIEVLLAAEGGLADDVVHEVGCQGCQDHEDTHGKDPDDQLAAHCGVVRQGQGQKRDQGHARDAVGLETVRRGTDAVARVVTGAVGDDAGVLRIVFRKVEDDLHEVGADVGDLREDTAADTEGGGAEGLTDGKTDEAGTGQFTRDVGQDDDHEKELDADQKQTHAHAGPQTDVDDAEGIPAQGGEGRPGVGHGVDPDAEPGHTIGTQDSQNGSSENDDHFHCAHMRQNAEIVNHAGTDQDPQRR